MMNTVNNYSPVFGAKYLNSVNIIKYNRLNNKYEKSAASFVELTKEDKDLLKELNNKWHDGIFIGDIYDDFVMDYRRKFYAVVSGNPQTPTADEVLTVGEINEGLCNEPYLEFLQTTPKSLKNPYYEYKKCGSAFLDGLKKLYKTITLKVASDDDIINFYKKNGFVQVENNYVKMSWDS